MFDRERADAAEKKTNTKSKNGCRTIKKLINMCTNLGQLF